MCYFEIQGISLQILQLFCLKYGNIFLKILRISRKMLQCFLNIYNYFYLKYSVISFTESISLKIMQLLAIFWDYFPQTVSLANQTKAGREKRRRVQVQAQ